MCRCGVIKGRLSLSLSNVGNVDPITADGVESADCSTFVWACLLAFKIRTTHVLYVNPFAFKPQKFQIEWVSDQS